MSETLLNQITIPHKEIAAFCQRYHIRKMALFGSVLNNELTPESDLDVLVEFEPDGVPGWEFVTIQDELSELFGREVDLNTAGFLSETFRDDVLKEAFVIYEREG